MEWLTWWLTWWLMWLKIKKLEDINKLHVTYANANLGAIIY